MLAKSGIPLLIENFLLLYGDNLFIGEFFISEFWYISRIVDIFLKGNLLLLNSSEFSMNSSASFIYVNCL